METTEIRCPHRETNPLRPVSSLINISVEQSHLPVRISAGTSVFLTERFHVSPQSLQIYVRIVRDNSPRPLLSPSFPVHCSLIIQPFNGANYSVRFNVVTASLNKLINKTSGVGLGQEGNFPSCTGYWVDDRESMLDSWQGQYINLFSTVSRPLLGSRSLLSNGYRG